MEQRGHKVLFVCPTNKLVQNNRENGVTLNHFFGVGISEDGRQKISKFDDKPYDTIVFDEIYFASVRMLAKIRRYSESHPEKIILATGDTDQLETIDLVSNRIDYDTYMNHCIDTVFPNAIHLKENKRLKTEEDKETLRRFKREIFDERLPIKRTIAKFFPIATEIETTSNIAYKNSTCDEVAKQAREKLLKKTTDYEVGEKLVCRKYLKTKGAKLNVNFEFAITAIAGETFTLTDESTSETFTLPKDLIRKHFTHSYCRTCHSFQGSSIDEKISIFDSTFHFVSRKWVYTAVTRATELKNFCFFQTVLLDSEEPWDQEAFDRYLNQKVENYKKQDLSHGRRITSNFVTTAWLKEQFGKTCPGCGDCLRFDIRGGRVDSNLTADRLDNDECHHLNNITPCCITCNQRKSCWD
jgi:hypothetical protein